MRERNNGSLGFRVQGSNHGLPVPGKLWFRGFSYMGVENLPNGTTDSVVIMNIV